MWSGDHIRPQFELKNDGRFEELQYLHLRHGSDQGFEAVALKINFHRLIAMLKLAALDHPPAVGRVAHLHAGLVLGLCRLVHRYTRITHPGRSFPSRSLRSQL